jgi:hypothetical protein
MIPTASLGIRTFYVLAGIALIALGVLESSGHSILYVPILFGMLLIVQGLSGA